MSRRTPNEKPLIVLAEDDPNMRDTIEDILGTLDYDCKALPDGQQAYDFIQNNQADLLITDIMMPWLDGVELLKKLKSDQRLCTIPVVMLTAKADPDTRLESLKFGADGYITKPFDIKELAYIINNLITLKQNLLSSQVKPDHPADPEWGFIQQLNEVLEENIENCSLDVIANAMQLSPSGLQKKLKRYSDSSFTEYVRIFKLAKAKALLQSGKSNVSESAFQAGFKSIPHFTRTFKEQFGTTPSQMIA